MILEAALHGTIVSAEEEAQNLLIDTQQKLPYIYREAE